MPTTLPPVWAADRLEQDRQVALRGFRSERIQEPLEEYLQAFDTYRAAVEDLLEATTDLSRLRALAAELLIKPNMLIAIRYLASPPISKDDLEALAETRLSPKSLRDDATAALRVVDHVLLGLDRNRFPWVPEHREATEDERSASTLATAALIFDVYALGLLEDPGTAAVGPKPDSKPPFGTEA